MTVPVFVAPYDEDQNPEFVYINPDAVIEVRVLSKNDFIKEYESDLEADVEYVAVVTSINGDEYYYYFDEIGLAKSFVRRLGGF